MNTKRKPKDTSSSLSPSDLKRLEEAFFTPPPETTHHKKREKSIFIYVLSLIVILLVSFFYFRYTVLIVPKPPESKDNLLSNYFLNSITFSSNKDKAQFSRGILYLSLDPNTPQEVTLNVKSPVNLEKNNLLLHFSLIEPTLEKGDLIFTVVVRNNDYRSTSLDPLKVVVDKNIHTVKDSNVFTVPIIYPTHAPLHMNFSHITQFRLGLLNSKNKPISFLIQEIKLARKEEKQ